MLFDNVNKLDAPLDSDNSANSQDSSGLDNLDIDKIEIFNFDKKTFICKCIDVYDGDSITVVFSLFNKYYKFKIRLAGIDTPEIRTKNPDEKKQGIISRDFLRSKILNKICKLECRKNDKYGRILSYVYINDENINELLITKNYAVSYDGGTKKPFKMT